MTEILPCINDDDSCEPGTVHHWPEPGSFVEVTCTEARIVGSDDYITLTPGQRVFVTEDRIVEAHQIAAALTEGERFWLDVDDDIKEKKA